VDEKSLAQASPERAPYVLYRAHPGGAGQEEPVSEHPDFASGWQAGTRAVTVEDKENAYTLYERGRCVAKFGRTRLMLHRGAMAERVLPIAPLGTL
jgi:hypothetical protein